MQDKLGSNIPKSERWTRKELVDQKLKVSGWKIVSFDPHKHISSYSRCAVEELPTENGPVDYALFVDWKTLGIVEAKKLTLGPQEVLLQAERYSKGLTT